MKPVARGSGSRIGTPMAPEERAPKEDGHGGPRQAVEALCSIVSRGSYGLLEKAIWATRASYSQKECDHILGEALRVAVHQNRIGMCEQLLTCVSQDPPGEVRAPLLVVAAKNSFTRIIQLLIKAGAKSGHEALIEAIKNGNVASVSSLCQSGIDTTKKNNEALVVAYSKNDTDAMRILTRHGAYIDARDGELLIDAATKGKVSMLRFLCKAGADPNIRDGEAVRQAALNHHAAAVDCLLAGGADESYLEDLHVDYYVKKTVENWKAQNRFLRLKRAVKGSFDRDTWKWQPLCRRPGDANLPSVMQQAKLFGITDINGKSKRALCADLAIATADREKSIEEMPGTDLYGVSMNELPKWKYYTIGTQVYNIFDLIRLLRKNYSTCPYTRNPLPKREIEEHRKFLERVLTRNAYKDINLVEQVRDMPLLTKEMELRTKLLNEVWSRLSYPPSMDLILKATDETLDDIIRNLYIIANDSYMFPMLTFTKRWELNVSRGLEKKELLVSSLIEVVRRSDDHFSTRIQALNILFGHYNDDGTTRNGPNDLLSFMLEDSESGPWQSFETSNRIAARLFGGEDSSSDEEPFIRESSPGGPGGTGGRGDSVENPENSDNPFEGTYTPF